MFKILESLITQIKKNKNKSAKLSYTASLIKGKNNLSLKRFTINNLTFDFKMFTPTPP